MVRPRYEEASSEAYEMLAKAQELLKKADMSMKDKYCMKRYGKKYSECSAEQKTQCDKNVDKVEKRAPQRDNVRHTTRQRAIHVRVRRSDVQCSVPNQPIPTRRG